MDLARHGAFSSKFDAVSHAHVMAGSNAETKGKRPQARSEITIGPLTTYARKTPEEVVRAPFVKGGANEE